MLLPLGAGPAVEAADSVHPVGGGALPCASVAAGPSSCAYHHRCRWWAPSFKVIKLLGHNWATLDQKLTEMDKDDFNAIWVDSARWNSIVLKL